MLHYYIRALMKTITLSILGFLALSVISVSALAQQHPQDMTQFLENINKNDNKSILGAHHAASGQTEDISRIEGYLNGITTLVADFNQVAPDGKESSGKFFLSRPGKLRWQYNPPTPILIVSNGAELSYYDYELKELSHTDASTTPAGFLARKNLSFSGDIQIDSFKKEPGVMRLTISQKGKEDQGKLTLVLNENPVFLRKLTLTDSTGQQTSVSLYNLKYGTRLDEALFNVHDVKLFAAH